METKYSNRHKGYGMNMGLLAFVEINYGKLYSSKYKLDLTLPDRQKVFQKYFGGDNMPLHFSPVNF